MIRPAAILLAGVLSAVAPGAAASQGVSRYQFAVDVGVISLGLSYAQRVRETRVSVGAGVWVAWEPANTFDRNVFEPRGVVVFARASYPRVVQIDMGVGLLRYAYGDDCSKCGGTFAGLRLGAHVGGRKLLFGPDLWIGAVSDAGHGSDLGFLLDLQFRLMLGWDH